MDLPPLQDDQDLAYDEADQLIAQFNADQLKEKAQEILQTLPKRLEVPHRTHHR